MLQEYEVHRFTRRCAATDRRLEPGETYFSALLEAPTGAERRDLSAEAWTGPPEDCVGWWRAVVPAPGAKPATAPNEVLVGLLEQWAADPARAELRYVLALLLVRRRIARIETDEFLEAIEDRPDRRRDALRVYCPMNDTAYEVEVATPGTDRLEAIEQELSGLLHAGDDVQPPAKAA